MFISYPSVAFVDSFWSRVKPEQSNLACLHLLYQEEQVPVCRGCPDLSGREASWNPEGECWLFSFKRMLKLSSLPCKTANELHTNHPQESGGLGKRSDHYHTNLISDQLRQSPCSICPATQAWGWHSNPSQPKDCIQQQMGFPNLYIHFSFKNNFIYLFILAGLGLHCYLGFSLVAASRSYSLDAGHGFSLTGLLFLQSRGSQAAGSVAEVPGLWSTGSVVVVHRLGCFAPRGILPGLGMNRCLLPWQVDSLPLSHQGSPVHPRLYALFTCGNTVQNLRMIW